MADNADGARGNRFAHGARSCDKISLDRGKTGMITFKKNGGIYFVKIGRFGCSFYIAKRKPAKKAAPLPIVRRERIALALRFA